MNIFVFIIDNFMDTPLFSVLMANFNNSKYLNESIDSILAQTYSNWEIILVDDGSNDEFEEVICKYRHEERIKVFRNEKNMGCSFTKRKCALLANGSILAYLDPDDTIAVDALRIMVTAHLQKPQCSIIHSTLYVCDEYLRIIRKADFPKALPDGIPYLLLSDGSIHAFATFKKASYDRTAGLEPVRTKDRAIDQELYYILEEQGSVFFIDLPLYYYRIHQGSISNWGNEVAANIQHFNIIEESCIRRIKQLKSQKSNNYKVWIKKYRTRLYKIRILNCFRQRKWALLMISALIFPFVGGMDNIISYIRKIPVEGRTLLIRTFGGAYKI